MDTCLLLTQLSTVDAEYGLKKARECLERFSFTEHRYSSEAAIINYKKMIFRAEQHWKNFLENGLQADLATVIDRPHLWVRLEGEITIEDEYYSVELFLYPISNTKAGVSVVMESSIFDAIQRFNNSTEVSTDTNIKEDFINFLIGMAASFSARGFVLRMLTDARDMFLPLTEEDIQEWLTSPTRETMSKWLILLAGIRIGAINRNKVIWKQVAESPYGYLFHDGLTF